jgi:hypothetical protein
LFIDLFVGLLGRVNDSKILRKSRLYVNAQQQGLFSANKGQDSFVPYLLGDNGYLLLSLLMTSHRDGETNILEMFYNKKHRRGQSIVENAFLSRRPFTSYKGK